ncbi:hypothetical protein [Nocardia suismassiliense]|uniref:hypothetical protein n=1 Tax=Nocardia suismassiliense TaxID=2077092 RepID=UPI001F43B436|nr:hypothetical protein [Nocardia suismassiliense]
MVDHDRDEPELRRLSLPLWPGADLRGRCRLGWLAGVATMFAVLALPVWYTLESIVWPSVWVRSDIWVDGRRVEKMQVSLQGAEWLQRVEVAAPGVILMLFAAVPGYLLIRILLFGELSGEAFSEEIIAVIARARRWILVAAVVFAVSWIVCAWLLSRDMGARVSPPSDVLLIVFMVAVAAEIYSVLAPVGRRLRDELDEVV